jgi:hypothetical protein
MRAEAFRSVMNATTRPGAVIVISRFLSSSPGARPYDATSTRVNGKPSIVGKPRETGGVTQMGLEHLVDAPLANILALAGILFLGIAALGGRKVPIPGVGTIVPSKAGRMMSGFLGLALLFGGTWSHIFHDTKQDVSTKPLGGNHNDGGQQTGTKRSTIYPRDLNISASATAGDYQFKILSARLDEYGQDDSTHVKTLLLTLHIRETFTSQWLGTGYFMPDGFRLIVDDTVASPKNCPIENIDKGTTKDGNVMFIVPDNARRVVLRVGYYDGQKSDITLPLFSQ